VRCSNRTTTSSFFGLSLDQYTLRVAFAFLFDFAFQLISISQSLQSHEACIGSSFKVPQPLAAATEHLRRGGMDKWDSTRKRSSYSWNGLRGRTYRSRMCPRWPSAQSRMHTRLMEHQHAPAEARSQSLRPLGPSADKVDRSERRLRSCSDNERRGRTHTTRVCCIGSTLRGMLHKRRETEQLDRHKAPSDAIGRRKTLRVHWRKHAGRPVARRLFSFNRTAVFSTTLFRASDHRSL
jgi:hypothetical protein